MTRPDGQMKIRLPADLKIWISGEAIRNGSSQSSEVVRAVRERMDRITSRVTPTKAD